MQSYLLVFLGGGLGSICRYGIAHFLEQQQYHFPWATFCANILSCILLGVLVGLSTRGGFPTPAKFLLMTGFCGGFSTFSTFTNETYQLLQNGDIAYAMANIAGSILLGLFCIFVGLKLVA